MTVSRSGIHSSMPPSFSLFFLFLFFLSLPCFLCLPLIPYSTFLSFSSLTFFPQIHPFLTLILISTPSFTYLRMCTWNCSTTPYFCVCFLFHYIPSFFLPSASLSVVCLLDRLLSSSISTRLTLTYSWTELCMTHILFIHTCIETMYMCT